MSQSTIYDIHQDKYGFIWFATEDGLNRYDGYELKSYRHIFSDPQSINDNTIYSIAETQDGFLWLGTHNGGINRYNLSDGTVSHYMNDPSDLNSLSSNYIYKLAVTHKIDDTPYIWAGTNNGLNFINTHTGIVTRYLHDKNQSGSIIGNNIQDLLIDHNGDLWIGTSSGLSKFNQDSNTFTNFVVENNNQNSLPGNIVYHIYEDMSGILWISTNMGTTRFNPLTGEFFIFDPGDKQLFGISNVILQIIEDHKGLFWFGSTRGFYKFDPQSNLLEPIPADPNNQYGLNGQYFMSLLEDNTHMLWIGTRSNGVNYIDYENINIGHFNFSNDQLKTSGQTSIYTIYQDKNNNIWFGSDGGGLILFDPDTGIYRQYIYDQNNTSSIISNYIFYIFEDSAQNIWICTDNGVAKTRMGSRSFQWYQRDEQDSNSLSDNTVFHMAESTPGVLWFATYGGGLTKFNIKKDIFTRYKHVPDEDNSIHTNMLNAILAGHDGTIWVGSDSGLEKFNPITGRFSHMDLIVDTTVNFVQTSVYSIFEDEDNTLWIGSNSGLFKYNPESQIFKNYKKIDGLPNEVINGIVEDSDHNLWISTNKGISRFNPERELFTNFDVNDGLQSNEFNAGSYFKNSAGRMYFGGVNGVSTFFPNHLEIRNQHSPLYVTNIMNFSMADRNNPHSSESYYNNQSLVLDYKNDFLSIEFSAIDFRAASKLIYFYKLVGFDESYLFSGSRRYANYTNLPPGQYYFQVKCLNPDLTVNNETDGLPILITPPFWEEMWFRVTFIVMVIIFIYLLIYLQTRRVERQRVYLKRVVDKKTEEIELAVKTKLSAIRELEIEKKYLEDLFNGSVDAIALTTTSGKVIKINRAFTKLFQFTPEDAIDKNIDELLSDNKRQKEAANLSKQVASGHQTTLETIRRKKNGSQLHVIIVGIPVLFQNGQLGIWAIYRDITERKQAESDIQDKVNRLENLNKFMVGREKKMIDLKNEINGILVKYGEPEKYDVDE